MCALTGQTDSVREAGEFALERFLASYR
jgi:hypothetical protein